MFIGIQIYPVFNKIKPTMSCIKSELTNHAKKQENINHNQERNQSFETKPEMLWMVELADNDN